MSLLSRLAFCSPIRKMHLPLPPENVCFCCLAVSAVHSVMSSTACLHPFLLQNLYAVPFLLFLFFLYKYVCPVVSSCVHFCLVVSSCVWLCLFVRLCLVVSSCVWLFLVLSNSPYSVLSLKFIIRAASFLFTPPHIVCGSINK